ncbi:SAM-dependent methyltransferase [Clostridium sp. 'deep sea']|uniref:TRM11 family SAM-dependent methyltransferase n=1 Tax=Clostridium sp. 'deep sea' TaxID=2779445 RepID=UPI0018969D8D|nr:SAM-dependent methyltransferase [Clostridium sp. 'deep sea']QOR34868.1 SAM-dependent methyltransferase [Clostridium sp. 'deep sea']
MNEISSTQYLYQVKHKAHEHDLCKLEIKSLFNINAKEQVFITIKKVDPAISPFITLRLIILHKANSFSDLLTTIKNAKYNYHDFKVEYVVLSTLCPSYHSRKSYCKQIGLHIIGYPKFTEPDIVLGITEYQGSWYFGVLNQDKGVWRHHKHKPYNYSASLNITTAKALVNIASEADFSKKLIDPCCGIGTVLLEALFAGYNIVGRDINYLVAKHANVNLKYFNYPQVVSCGDIKDITELYDVAIIDMPYGLYYYSDNETKLTIINSAKKIAKKVVFVHCEDISATILKAGFEIIDTCVIGKGVKNRSFSRSVWVCQ